MSWKPEESIHDILFDETETKLLVSNSKPSRGIPWIHKVIGLKSIRENKKQKFEFY